MCCEWEHFDILRIQKKVNANYAQWTKHQTMFCEEGYERKRVNSIYCVKNIQGSAKMKKTSMQECTVIKEYSEGKKKDQCL